MIYTMKNTPLILGEKILMGYQSVNWGRKISGNISHIFK